MDSHESLKKFTNISSVLIGVTSIIFIIYGIKNNLFTSQNALSDFLGQFGLWAPIIFILFQVVQVVFPVIPGGISLLAGVIIFGPIYGFIYNYIGIIIGSAIAFLLAKYYGTSIIKRLFGKKMMTKYTSWTENKKFSRMFAVAIFMPIAPDDFLCYLAGTTKMRFEYFLTTIVLGKPLSIAAYSFGLNFILGRLVGLIR